MTIPFCKDCCHLLGKRDQTEFAAGWQCLAEQNIQRVSSDPVTGRPVRVLHWETCKGAREAPSACGLEGRWFKLYEKPDYSKSSPNAPGKVSADALLDELENLK